MQSSTLQSLSPLKSSPTPPCRTLRRRYIAPSIPSPTNICTLISAGLPLNPTKTSWFLPLSKVVRYLWSHSGASSPCTLERLSMFRLNSSALPSPPSPTSMVSSSYWPLKSKQLLLLKIRLTLISLSTTTFGPSLTRIPSSRSACLSRIL